MGIKYLNKLNKELWTHNNHALILFDFHSSTQGLLHHFQLISQGLFNFAIQQAIQNLIVAPKCRVNNMKMKI